MLKFIHRIPGKEVVRFLVSSAAENAGGLAWSENDYTTSEGKQYTIPNCQMCLNSMLKKYTEKKQSKVQ
jgi:hypothetical protein